MTRASDYLALTKPGLSLLSVITAVLAYLATRTGLHSWRLFWVAIGTSLSAAGVAALNQWIERDTDAQMRRTADRPIPSGRIPNGSAFVMGWILCIAGLMVTFAGVNPLAALFTLLTMVAYLACYTPAKRRWHWSTEVGSVAGALPPLIGWAGGEGRISALGWIFFGILFFWQIPHFFALAWFYRRDYSAAHFPVRPALDQTGARTARWSLLNTAILAVVSLLPVWLHLDSQWYGAAALLCNAWFLWRAVEFLTAADRDKAARRLFFTSIAYLPAILGALVVDRLIFF